MPSSLPPSLATKTPESPNTSSSFLWLSHQLFLSPFGKTLIFALQLSLSDLFQGRLASFSVARVKTWGKEPLQGRLHGMGVRRGWQLGAMHAALLRRWHPCHTAVKVLEESSRSKYCVLFVTTPQHLAPGLAQSRSGRYIWRENKQSGNASRNGLEDRVWKSLKSEGQQKGIRWAPEKSLPPLPYQRGRPWNRHYMLHETLPGERAGSGHLPQADLFFPLAPLGNALSPCSQLHPLSGGLSCVEVGPALCPAGSKIAVSTCSGLAPAQG